MMWLLLICLTGLLYMNPPRNPTYHELPRYEPTEEQKYFSMIWNLFRERDYQSVILELMDPKIPLPESAKLCLKEHVTEKIQEANKSLESLKLLGALEKILEK